MSTAEDILNEIDDLLQREGYDSWRQNREAEFEKVKDAFYSLFRDFQKSKAGELRDEIERLNDELAVAVRDGDLNT